MRDVLIRGGHVVTLDSELGTIPAADMLVVGGRVAAIGPDLPHMFTQMRTALAHGRGDALPRDPAGVFAPTLTHEDVLRFATINGAAACGLDHRVGTLGIGKEADIVMLRADAVNIMSRVKESARFGALGVWRARRLMAR